MKSRASRHPLGDILQVAIVLPPIQPGWGPWHRYSRARFLVESVAEILFHRAKNQVPLAIVQIDRTPGHIEIRLQAQAALAKVCFAASGPNSPYLLASGRNYRYLGGDNVTACPERRDYAANDVMVLRVEPPEVGSSTFSFVSGQGDEKQSIAAVSSTTPYWNFLRVRLN